MKMQRTLSLFVSHHSRLSFAETRLPSLYTRLWGFPLACPANSRLRRAYDGLEIDNLPKGPSFVADHRETMNLCSNPEWQYLHGECPLPCTSIPSPFP